MTAAYGWGIVGTGQMAATMAATLATSPQARLVAAASRDIARAQHFAQAHAIPHPCQGLAALLARPDVDVVYIATPAAQHHQDCLQALAAGKHVLCEKPLATTAGQASEIARAAAQAGRFCMEALWTHFLPAVSEAASLLATGAIGTGMHIAASFGIPTDPAHHVFQPAGGGALLDRGVYPISLALRLFGTTAQVSGTLTRASNGIDTDAVLLLDFADGNTAALATSLTSYLANDLVISGTGGRITLHEPITSPALLSIAHAQAGTAAPTQGWRRQIKRVVRKLPVLTTLARLRGTRSLPFIGNGYRHQIDEVHRCLGAGQLQSTTVPLALSIATLDVIDSLKDISA